MPEKEKAVKPKPATRWDFEITADMMEDMLARAREWKSDPDKMLAWFEERQSVCFQIYFLVVSNPLTSRSGPDKLLKAIEDFLTYGAWMVGALNAARRL